MLKDERKKAKLSQEQFAKKIGTQKSYISRIERASSDIQLSTLFKIFEDGLGLKLNLSVIHPWAKFLTGISTAESLRLFKQVFIQNFKPQCLCSEIDFWGILHTDKGIDYSIFPIEYNANDTNSKNKQQNEIQSN